MSRRTGYLLLFFATLLGGTRLARAEGGFSVGVEGGVMQFDTRASLDSAGMAWGIRGGISFIGPLRLEARFLSASRDMAGGGSSNIREGDAQLRLAPFPRLPLMPYAFGGIGLRLAENSMPTQHASENVLMAPIGGGLDIPVAGFIILAPEFTWHHRIGDVDPALPPEMGRDTWNLSLVLRLDV